MYKRQLVHCGDVEGREFYIEALAECPCSIAVSYTHLLYREIGESYKGLDRWSMYLITAYDKAENDIGRKADKNRKIYNGMMKTYYYQFLGPRPPKKGSIKE